MLFQSILLFASALCAAVNQPQSDNFYFGKDCYSPLEPGNYRKIVLGEDYRPQDSTELKKLWWNYPSKEIKLEFFADKSAKNPYATITPTGNYFVASVCGLDGAQWAEESFTVSKRGFLKGDVYFLNENSFVRASRSGL
ncbi:hypothetical protein HDV02_002027 [Globomyces sp. JEL0801]|nr:hypothetical protein HDV02_002027 [Globomyces sp. JEL0801]